MAIGQDPEWQLWQYLQGVSMFEQGGSTKDFCLEKFAIMGY